MNWTQNTTPASQLQLWPPWTPWTSPRRISPATRAPIWDTPPPWPGWRPPRCGAWDPVVRSPSPGRRWGPKQPPTNLKIRIQMDLCWILSCFVGDSFFWGAVFMCLVVVSLFVLRWFLSFWLGNVIVLQHGSHKIFEEQKINLENSSTRMLVLDTWQKKCDQMTKQLYNCPAPSWTLVISLNLCEPTSLNISCAKIMLLPETCPCSRAKGNFRRELTKCPGFNKTRRASSQVRGGSSDPRPK